MRLAGKARFVAIGAGVAIFLASLPALPTLAAQQKAPASKTSSQSPKKSTSSKSVSSKTRKKTSSASRKQTAPTPERIREIQAALREAGHYSGDLSGKWDIPTVEAMKAFQEANGLTPTGKLDARSLQKLGLGAQIAGLSPPRPPSNPPPPPQQ
jgi:peptidoglycan hydrolase-like protein with peptidoglycan-binding domain